MRNTKNLDILAIGAHPDDVEACAAGLLIKCKKNRLKTGIIDMTRGEASNYGGVEERVKEAKKASKILKLDARENLNIPDEHVIDNEENILKIVKVLRKYRPEIILLPYYADLHPDHATTGVLGIKAAFFAKMEKYSKKLKLHAHQPSLVMFYMLHTEFRPSFILDITKEYPTKLKAIYAHRSQFFLKIGNKYINKFHNREFMEFFEARSKVYGYKIGANYGEPYLLDGYLGLNDITHIRSGDFRSLTSWKKK